MVKIFSGTPEEWDLIVGNEEYSGAFLQSSLWARVLELRGNRVVRIVHDSGSGSLWVYLRILPGVWVWFCPKGPTHTVSQEVIALLQSVAHATIVRCEPLRMESIELPAQQRRDVSPSHTLVTSLEGDFSSHFHEKTRYNMRLAERHGVVVSHVQRTELHRYIPVLHELYGATGTRHEIQAMPQRDMDALFQMGEVWIAEHDGRVIATSVHIGHGKTMTYVHGASLYEARALMGPYALHGAVMRDAASRGFSRYDWWGVAPENAETHPLAGVTRFKRGFGGVYESAPGTFDISVDRFRYGLYTLLRRMRS